MSINEVLQLRYFHEAVARADAAIAQFASAEQKVNDMLVGHRAIVTSKFNDQQYGSSKKPLTGKIFLIDEVLIDRTFGLCVRSDIFECTLSLRDFKLYGQLEEKVKTEKPQTREKKDYNDFWDWYKARVTYLKTHPEARVESDPASPNRAV